MKESMGQDLEIFVGGVSLLSLKHWYRGSMYTPHTRACAHPCAHTHVRACAHMHTRTRTHTCAHTHMHTHARAHTHAHTHARAHTHMHTHAHTHTCTHAHTRTYMHTHAHRRAHTYTHTHMHTHARAHTHTHTHRWARDASETQFSLASEHIHDVWNWIEFATADTLSQSQYALFLRLVMALFSHLVMSHSLWLHGL